MSIKSGAVVLILSVSGLVLFAGFRSGNASASEPATPASQAVTFPIFVPVGSYWQTCNTCSWQKNLTHFQCTCAGNNPNQPTTVNLSKCPNFPQAVSLANYQGTLACGS